MSYDNFATTFSNSRKNHPWPELDAIIDDMRKQGYTSVLDIGCGNGRFLEEIQSSGFKVQEYLGIDSSKWMIAEARKLHPDFQFEVCSMESLFSHPAIPLSRYPAILFLASFHHLETRVSRIETLKQAKELLAPNGRIYMTNWNLLEQEKYRESHQWNGDYDIKIGEFSRYYHGFTVEELAELFEEAGLEVVENGVFEGGRNIVSILTKI